MNLNKTFVLGNLTRDPERRALPSGQPVCNFSIATNRFYTSNDGQKQQEAEFHNIVAFGKTAEIASQYLKKGALALIEGRLKTRTWDDKAGVKHYKTEIIAERLQLPPRSLGQTQPTNSDFIPQPASQTQTVAQPQTSQPVARPATIPTIQQDDIPVINEAGQTETPTPKPPQVDHPTPTTPVEEPKPEDNKPQDNTPIQDNEEISVKDIPF